MCVCVCVCVCAISLYRITVDYLSTIWRHMDLILVLGEYCNTTSKVVLLKFIAHTYN